MKANGSMAEPSEVEFGDNSCGRWLPVETPVTQRGTAAPFRRVSAARARPSKCKTATSSLGRTIEIKAQRFRSEDPLFWVASCRASGWLTSSAISSSSARVHVTSSTRRISGRFRRPLTQLGRLLCNSPLNRLMASWPSPILRFRIPKIEQSTAGIGATSGQQFVQFLN